MTLSEYLKSALAVVAVGVLGGGYYWFEHRSHAEEKETPSNALVIVALIPLALRGIKYRPIGAARLLSRHLLVYGLGGIIVPFVGIKLIDLLLVALRLV